MIRVCGTGLVVVGMLDAQKRPKKCNRNGSTSTGLIHYVRNVLLCLVGRHFVIARQNTCVWQGLVGMASDKF